MSEEQRQNELIIDPTMVLPYVPEKKEEPVDKEKLDKFLKDLADTEERTRNIVIGDNDVPIPVKLRESLVISVITNILAQIEDRKIALATMKTMGKVKLRNIRRTAEDFLSDYKTEQCIRRTGFHFVGLIDEKDLSDEELDDCLKTWRRFISELDRLRVKYQPYAKDVRRKERFGEYLNDAEITVDYWYGTGTDSYKATFRFGKCIVTKNRKQIGKEEESDRVVLSDGENLAFREIIVNKSHMMSPKEKSDKCNRYDITMKSYGRRGFAYSNVTPGYYDYYDRIVEFMKYTIERSVVE